MYTIAKYVLLILTGMMVASLGAYFFVSTFTSGPPRRMEVPVAPTDRQVVPEPATTNVVSTSTPEEVVEPMSASTSSSTRP